MKFKSKAEEVEAVLFNKLNATAVAIFLGLDSGYTKVERHADPGSYRTLTVIHLSGETISVYEHDWILRTPDGRHVVLPDHLFHRLFTPAS